MVQLESDRTLLKGFRRGDQEALVAVYRGYVESLAGFFVGGFNFSSGGQPGRFQGFRDHADLHNAIQETFARAFTERARLGYDGLRPYENYLLTIGRNVVIDEYRRAEKRMSHFAMSEVPEAEIHEAGAQSQASTDRGAEQSELAKLMDTFLATLSPLEQAVVEQRFRQQLPQREAAAALGMGRMKLRLLETKVRKKALSFFKDSGYLAEGPNSASRATLLFAVMGAL